MPSLARAVTSLARAVASLARAVPSLARAVPSLARTVLKPSDLPSRGTRRPASLYGTSTGTRYQNTKIRTGSLESDK